MYRRSCLALLTLLLLCPLVACTETQQGQGTGATVRVVATRDFGAEILLEETVDVPHGTSAMEALQTVASVETRYGGGFVHAIEGVRSQYPVKDDWFFYLNGILSNKGASDCTVRDGDLLVFDLHDWAFRMYIWAMIGGDGETFLYGFEGRVRPTAIVYGEGLTDLAGDLAAVLDSLGLDNVQVYSPAELPEGEKTGSNLIILGTTDCPLIDELNRNWDRLGFFVRLGDGVMEVYGPRGEVTAEYGSSAGVLQATQNPWNPGGTGVCDNVVWMVSGTDEAGVAGAVSALADLPDDLRYSYAVVAAGGELVRVPQ
jgi:hypothetical protein